MLVSYEDERRSAFLGLIDEKYRGDVGNLFAVEIRRGETDAALICRCVWAAVGTREAERAGDLGPGTIPAATLRQIMRDNTQAALAYVDWLLLWEALTPDQKRASKAPTAASFRAQWYRDGRRGGAR
jgi:hypothetical protein